ncbi:hypothetical protein AGLY_006307 [Aphis glycines]|uniref:Uncharacterized protein n=1 Tax=Aphis glycines TaxID=307491 RepID=A0A6G0TQS7_APHGL|nr:hypothetical protein AGLY_006307 [Aphis glycines]
MEMKTNFYGVVLRVMYRSGDNIIKKDQKSLVTITFISSVRRCKVDYYDQTQMPYFTNNPFYFRFTPKLKIEWPIYTPIDSSYIRDSTVLKSSFGIFGTLGSVIFDESNMSNRITINNEKTKFTLKKTSFVSTLRFSNYNVILTIGRDCSGGSGGSVGLWVWSSRCLVCSGNHGLPAVVPPTHVLQWLPKQSPNKLIEQILLLLLITLRSQPPTTSLGLFFRVIVESNWADKNTPQYYNNSLLAIPNIFRFFRYISLQDQMGCFNKFTRQKTLKRRSLPKLSTQDEDGCGPGASLGTGLTHGHPQHCSGSATFEPIPHDHDFCERVTINLLKQFALKLHSILVGGLD